MKIAIITDKIGPQYIGGYEVRLQELASRLSAGNEVRVYTSLTGPEEGSASPFVIPIPPYLARRRVASRSLGHSILFCAGMLRSPFHAWKPDVVLVNAIPYAQLVTMRSWARDLDCVKILDVAEAWDDYLPSSGWWRGLLSPVFRYPLKVGIAWADRVFATSETTAQSVTGAFHHMRVDIVPSGVKTSEPRQSPSDRDREAVFDFVTVGRLVSIKRHSDFLRALGILRRRGWTGHAAIVGTGPLAEPLRRLNVSLGLQLQVQLFVATPNLERSRILDLSRVFVLCSEREGQSLSTLEALSHGLPAIVSRPRTEDVFGVRELVQVNENGIYYGVGDCESLAGAMQRLVEDRPLRLAMGQASLRVARRYDWDEIASKAQRLMRESLDGD